MCVPFCFLCTPTYDTSLAPAGLKETAIALSDPFGMDAVDFETDVFMARIMINTKELIARQATYVPKEMPLPPMNFFGEDEGTDMSMSADGYQA